MIGRFALFSSKPRSLARAERLLEEGEVSKAFSLFAKLAKAGMPEAAYRVGQCYLSGQGTPPSLEEGARWTRIAAEAGIKEASFTLATLFAMGVPEGFDLTLSVSAGRGLYDQVDPEETESYKPDFAQARIWAEKGAAAGSVEAQALLGHIFNHGPEEIQDRQAARHWYGEAVQGGSLQGALGLGLILLEDAEDDDQRAQAMELLQRAAEGGIGLANAAMGWIYEHGANGQPRDAEVSARYYLKAAEQNIPSAQARYGLMLLKGVGVETNVIQGESWLRRAAYGGDAEAAALLGDLYIRGEELFRRPMEAARWYQLAAEQAHTPAARVLAVLYLTGTGVPRDERKAAYWFNHAATLGDHMADADLGNLVLAGVTRPDEEQHNLQQRLRQQAEGGNPLGAFNLGVCLAQGVGGTPDETEAFYWLGLAREGVVNAQYWYGRLLFEGRGVAQNRQDGLSWMDKAARQGMPEACVSVAQMLVTGQVDGVRDHARALELYQQAADAGLPEAYFSLGAMYGGGHDVPADLPRAREYFEEAAQRGHGLGQMMLGRYLLKGLGGPEDSEQARYWLEQAARQGLGQAQKLLDSFATASATLPHEPSLVETRAAP
ncbi:sel1 repeat family protein [Acetobacteraceae bacterium B3987]|nr:sel1 repeat family protein [Acetobacteraceae bacterium B3987]